MTKGKTMRPSCTMYVDGERVLFNSPTTQLDISAEDFNTMLEMYELITNNYYHSDFCTSDEAGKWIVGSLKEQINKK